MRYQIVVIGSSRGSPESVVALLAELPRDFALPVVVACRAGGAHTAVRELLQDRALLPVIEIEDKLRIVPGRIHLAPPDYHLLVERDRFALSTDAPADERPSIDVLFDSAVDAYHDGVIGVLVGEGSDGGHGFARVGEAGGLTLVQPRATDLISCLGGR